MNIVGLFRRMRSMNVLKICSLWGGNEVDDGGR